MTFLHSLIFFFLLDYCRYLMFILENRESRSYMYMYMFLLFVWTFEPMPTRGNESLNIFILFYFFSPVFRDFICSMYYCGARKISKLLGWWIIRWRATEAERCAKPSKWILYYIFCKTKRMKMPSRGKSYLSKLKNL